MTKRWLFLLLVLAFSILGCNRSQESVNPNTIIFSFPEADLSFYRPLVNEFYLAHPGITVKLEAVPDDQLSQQHGDVQVVSWDIAADEISWSANNYQALDQWIARDEAFNQEDFFPGAMVPFTDKDKISAIPYGMDLDILFYNKEIFAAQEVPFPGQNWRWDSFLDTAARLTEREHNVFGYSAARNFIDSLYFLYQGGGQLLTADALPALDSPANIQAMQWYTRLFTTLNVAPTMDQAQRAFGAGLDVFALGISGGKVGMWTGAYSTRGRSPLNGAALVFDYGTTPLPRGEQLFTSGSFEAYAISTNTMNADASWKLIQFLHRKPNPRLIPARQSVAASSEYARSVGASIAATAVEMASHTIVFRHDQAGTFIKARQKFLEAVSSMVRLQNTPSQALQQAQSSLQP